MTQASIQVNIVLLYSIYCQIKNSNVMILELRVVNGGYSSWLDISDSLGLFEAESGDTQCLVG